MDQKAHQLSIYPGLPGRKSQEQATGQEQPLGHPGGLLEVQGARILVVDGTESSLRMLKIILETLKFQVSTASSAEEAWEQLEGSAETPRLVIIDRGLPGALGADGLSQRIRQTERLGRPAVLLLAEEGETTSQTLDGAPVEMLVRPVSLAAVYEAVVRALGYEKWAAAAAAPAGMGQSA